MPLDLDIEPAVEKTAKRLKPCLGHGCITRRESPVHGPIGAAGECYQAGGILLQFGQHDMRRTVIAMIEKSLARKPHEIAVTGRILGQQDKVPVMCGGIRAGPGGFLGRGRKRHAQRAAHDRLDAFAREIFGKFESAEKIVAVGDRERGLGIRRRHLGERLHRHRALQQRIGGMHMQVDKARRGHKPPLRKSLARCRA